MVVDFALRDSPSYRVASIVRIGPWKEDNLRVEFRELTRWAQKNRVRTGHWIFFERDHHRWEACLEIKDSAKAEGRIRLKTLPATPVARVVFNPDAVSSRIVYHGLSDWTRWRKKYGEIRSVTAVREVYTGDPWADKKAWANCEVQFVVRK
ncbi:MAG: GyrI-like domain-containing protein [Thermoplasmata archaeon]|nr:GyrI-like domain-containing protein [Thermoplasmata archaeon]